MNEVVVASILLRLGGVGYSLVLLSRSGDRRFAFLTLMLSLMATRQILSVQHSTTALEELPGLAVSVLAILTVYYLSSYVVEERRLTDRLRGFQKAVDHAGHAIFLTDTDGTIEYANPTVEQVTGHDPAAVVGENPRLWKSGEHDDAFYAEMWEQISSGAVWEGEIINRRKSGDLCWVDMTIAPITNEAGDIERYVAVERDVTERKERQLRIQKQNERLEVLNNTNRVLRDVNRDLVAASTREEIEQALCARFANSTLFDAAWVGERGLVDGAINSRACRGIEMAELDAADSHRIPIEEALDSGAPVFVENVPATTDAVADAAGMVVVPLSYHGANYGALVVLAASDEAFDAVDRDLFADLGATVAGAINAAESKQTLASDNVTQLTFQLDDADDPLVGLSAALDCTVELRRAARDGDGDHVEYVSLEGCDPDAVTAYLDGREGIDVCQRLCTYEDRCLYRLVFDEPSVVTTLADYGAAVTELSTVGGTGRLVAEVSRGNDIRSVVEAVQSAYPDLTLVAQREQERNAATDAEFRATLEAALTDRQLEAAQTAYFAGFFEWPRESSGEDVATAMDISQSTFTQHLRAAERKLFAALFDDATTQQPQAA